MALGRTPYREAELRAAVGRLWGLKTLGLSLHPGHKTRYQKCRSGNQHVEKGHVHDSSGMHHVPGNNLNKKCQTQSRAGQALLKTSKKA